MTRVLLICNDIVGKNMAGPGIRYWELTRALGQHFDVTLAVPPFIAPQTPPSGEDWLRICPTVRELRALVEDCDVVVTLGVVLFLYPFVAESGKPLVVDLYDPFLLEDLQRKAHMDWLDRLISYENYLEALWLQLRAGDFFICAGEKQRDYWLGMLSAAGRVNPYTYQDDPSLRRLIAVVPFGLPAEPPQHTHPVLKGVSPFIQPHDKVILWGGGIWEWFDAPTMIKAMPRILAHRDDVKLFFMGIKRSNQERARTTAVEQAIALSKEMGLYGTHIFFNDWVPYDERQNYLLEADVGVSLHLDHVETRFAFRTRLLDYLWAGLPIVATVGDVMGETLAAQGLATLVAPGDVEGVARAILDVLRDPIDCQERRDRIQEVAKNYRWDIVVKPLADFCAAPYTAPDKGYPIGGVIPSGKWGGWRRLLQKGWRALRLGGARGIVTQLHEYARWKVRHL
ncbi:MAG TPA: glycosyltransferase family 4 protein [Thermoflexia bacterium]|jgi:glycosyltransferase involved in cell wall biosynthesis|nr:glycosyltransferase family 4 protein [Thermoflexia bacterium]